MNCNKLSVAFAELHASAVLAVPASAANAVVHTNKIRAAGVGEPMGKIRLIDSRDYGLRIVPDLQGLEPGVHGFHVHEKPDCSSAKKDGKVVPAAAAGDNYSDEPRPLGGGGTRVACGVVGVDQL